MDDKTPVENECRNISKVKCCGAFNAGIFQVLLVESPNQGLWPLQKDAFGKLPVVLVTKA